MNKTTLILLVLFVVLGGGVWWYTQNDTPKTTLTELNDYYMAIDDLDQVHKVFIADRDGQTVTIERNGNHWIYNDKYVARPNAVDLVLDVLKRVRLKYRAPKAAIPHAVKYMASQGVKVEVYNEKNENIRTMYVGGTTPDERGTYMMLEGGETPHVMYLPAWEGSIRGRFFFGDDKWRDKTVFAETHETITELSVDYPEQQKQSFKIKRSNDGFDVEPLYKETPAITAPVNQDLVEIYLDGFTRLGAEGFENDNPQVDSIAAQTPFSVVSLTNSKGENKMIRVFPLMKRDSNNMIIKNEKVERFIVQNQDDDAYLIQQVVFGKIFRPYTSFFRKEN